jgi:hypothetical protein
VAAIRLTWDEVRARRLHRGHLVHLAPADRVVEVVADAAGIQAQVLSAAEVAVVARVADVTLTDIRSELWERRSLVKTWGPRGTLHLLPARELPMWMAAMRAVRADGAELWRELAGVTAAQEQELARATRDALDGRSLTRDGLATEVAVRVGSWARERLLSPWGDLLSPAALTGALCFGPSVGARVTFVRADQWIGGWPEVDEATALDEVARRFLHAYGPSTAAEFGRWVGATPTTAERVFRRLAGELEAVDVEGTAAVGLRTDMADTVTAARDLVRLLPQYDAFVLGSRPREQLIPAAVNARIRGYRRGKFEGAVALSTVMVDGRLIGIWERRVKARRLEISIELVGSLSASAQEALDVEVVRVAAAFEREPVVRFGPLD